MRNERAPVREIKGVAKGARGFAKVSDIVLAVVFAYLAYRQLDQGGFWFWAFALSSVFCAWTAYKSPIDMMWNAVHARMYNSRKA